MWLYYSPDGRRWTRWFKEANYDYDCYSMFTHLEGGMDLDLNLLRLSSDVGYCSRSPVAAVDEDHWLLHRRERSFLDRQRISSYRQILLHE